MRLAITKQVIEGSNSKGIGNAICEYPEDVSCDDLYSGGSKR